MFCGGVIESAAYNPTLAPLQAALIAVHHGGARIRRHDVVHHLVAEAAPQACCVVGRDTRGPRERIVHRGQGTGQITGRCECRRGQLLGQAEVVFCDNTGEICNFQHEITLELDADGPVELEVLLGTSAGSYLPRADWPSVEMLRFDLEAEVVEPTP